MQMPKSINGVMLRDSWQKGSIRYSTYSNAWLLAPAALFAAAGGWGLLQHGVALGNPAVGVPLVFAFFLGAAGRLGWRNGRKFGTVWCDLVTNPGVLGGWFTVRIRTRYALKEGDVAVGVLTNEKRTKHTSKDLWQQAVSVAHEDIQRNEAGEYAIPMVFYIPIDCQPTKYVPNQLEHYEWNLEVRFEVPGNDLRATFEVPVFQTEQSAEAPPEETSRYFKETVQPVERDDGAGGAGQNARPGH